MMARERGVSSGEDPINLRAHEIRTGSSAGARADFEAMVHRLVRVHRPDVHRVRVSQGDGGIDAFVGSLNGGPIIVWQAKYFEKEIGKSQRDQVAKSFQSAYEHARERQNTIAEWILCVPLQLSVKEHQWWDAWRQERRDLGVRIRLWDEEELLALLSRPEARDVRQEFYGRRTSPSGFTESVGPVVVSVRPSPPTTWEPGAEHTFRGKAYMLYDDLSERQIDRASVFREGPAGRVEGGHPLVHLKQVHLTVPTHDGATFRDGLCEQARVLGRLPPAANLPTVDWWEVTDRTATLATTQPWRTPTWRRMYGPRGGEPADLVTVGRICQEAARVARTLAHIHRTDHTHRSLTPDSILANPRSGGPTLRDGGLIALPPAPEECHEEYRAPEQRRMSRHDEIGPATDAYQLASLIYHTITGYRAGATSPSIRAGRSEFPADLDELVFACLRTNPGDRPGDLDALSRDLEAVSARMARGGQ